ncbi:carbon-nitrogen hydrolase family protein [Streptomyces sp. NPDC012389]|uniref:carbon-nitrogen hydrolase family protein n=1 Tax=Streptomyces sp. NPDC012389 TaxID=3364830 RepID=UPI0036E897BA
MKIAAAQLTSAPADIPANVHRLTALAGQARDQGAELLVQPELALTGYELDALFRDPALLVPGPDDPRLDALRSTGIAMVVNCAVRSGGSATPPAIGTFVYGPDGALLTTYLKQHLHEQENAVFAPGDQDGRFELGGLRFALATCYDSHFPDLPARAPGGGLLAEADDRTPMVVTAEVALGS